MAACLALLAHAVDADAAQALAKRQLHEVLFGLGEEGRAGVQDVAAKYKGQADAEQAHPHLTTAPILVEAGGTHTNVKTTDAAETKNLVSGSWRNSAAHQPARRRNGPGRRNR